MLKVIGQFNQMKNTVSNDRLLRDVLFQAFDDFPKEVQDALNYADIGFTLKDILYLHNLYITKQVDSTHIIKLIKQKEAFVILTAGLNGLKL
jgi:hypothetical protein